MSDLYTWTTGNGRKIVIMLEEIGIPYTVDQMNIRRGDQFKPYFLKTSPDNKVPAIVDRAGPGGKFWPADIAQRYVVIEWLPLTVAGLGPAIGQAHYFHGPGKDGNERAAERFTNETRRVFNVLEKRLEESPWLGGADYSIGDISAYGRVPGYKAAGLDIEATPRLKDWLARIAARPASMRADTVIADIRAKDDTPLDDAAREMMYGATQFARC